MKGIFILYISIAIFLNEIFDCAQARGPDLYSLVRDHHIGSTFCQFLAWKMQIHFKTDCKQPTCNWDNWQDALNKKASNPDGKVHKHSQQKRVVVSYGHNGFGNQLWSHTVAFMIAEALNARLLIAIIPDELSPDGTKPPNTWAGMAAMERLLPNEFLYEKLPANSSARRVCEQENFIVADRPRDWRNREYSSSFKENLYNMITDTQPRCIKLLGYFQNLPLCADDVRRLWTPNMFGNFTLKPGEQDVSIYLRCQPRHYHFNNKHFYDNILSRLQYEKLWLFMAPECPDPSKLNADPSRDGHVAAVVRLLSEKYKGKRWPSAAPGSDDEVYLLHDLAGLAQSKRLIIPVSSWAFWAGVLSNASEIHVNSPPRHQLMPAAADQYIYHDEKDQKYFGKFDRKEGDIIYTVDGKSTHPPRPLPPSKAISISAVNMTGKAPAKADPSKIADLAAAVDAAATNSALKGSTIVEIDSASYNVSTVLRAVRHAIKALEG